MVIAVFAIVALVARRLRRLASPAAIAVAAMGGLALLIFLISDLRVANATGTLNETAAARLVLRRRGGPAGRLLPGAGRRAGAGGHRDRPGDADPASSSRALRPAASATGRPSASRDAAEPTPSTRRAHAGARGRASKGRLEPARRAGRAPASAASGRRGLPAVVGEGLVGLRHAVDVVLALPGAALLLRSSRGSRWRGARPSTSRGGCGRSRRASGRRGCGRGAAGTSTGTW